MEQDIKLILEWVSTLSEIDKYLLKEDKRLILLIHGIYENSFFSVEEKMLKWPEIENKRSKICAFRDLISSVSKFVTENLETIKNIEEHHGYVDFLLSEETYLSIFKTCDVIEGVIKEIRLLSLSVYQILKSNEEYVELRHRVTEFERHLDELSERITKIQKDQFENINWRKEEKVEDELLKEIYKTDGDPRCYKSLDDILLEALSYGYSYSFYYDLAVESLIKQRFLSDKKNQEVNAYVALQGNDTYVIQRNAMDEGILSLYSDESLYDVREKLLQEMHNRKNGFAKDEEDSKKVATIGRVLARREESL